MYLGSLGKDDTDCLSEPTVAIADNATVERAILFLYRCAVQIDNSILGLLDELERREATGEKI
jgi:hypothetical protein